MPCAVGTCPSWLRLAAPSTWVSGCDRLYNVFSASSNIQKDIDSFQQQTQNELLSETNEEANPSWAQYSPEAFVDVIMEFIIADDQVCFLQSLHLLYLICSTSHSMSVKVQSCKKYF